MHFTLEQHRLWISNFLNGKVKEFHFYLQWIVRCHDQAITALRMGCAQPESAHAEIIYAFSAFSNAVQTLKDASSAVLEPQITWKDMDRLRHGEFMRMSRNAATHDGHPVISAWTDGGFYVPNDIHRFDNKGKLIQINRPLEDMRTVCLEFAHDFSVYLSSKLRPLEQDVGQNFSVSDIEQFMQSSVVPEFARKLLQENKVQIEESLRDVKRYPAKEAISALEEVKSFCTAQLASA